MTRRGPNEGNIRRRADGRWEARINLGYAGGRRVRKSVYGATRKEVADQLTTLQGTRQQGMPIHSDERQTLADFLDRWHADVATPALRPRTAASYGDMIRIHVVPELGRIRLAKLTAGDVQGFINRRLSSGASPRTVAYGHAVLRKALADATRWGVLPRNVAAVVSAPRAQAPERRPLTPSQARAFLDFIRGDRLEGLYTVAIALGLRQGEAFALRWSDVDFEAGTITVARTIDRTGGGVAWQPPKTERSKRTIAMPDEVVRALRSHRTRQLRDRLLAGSRWQPVAGGEDLVFTSTVGTPLHSRRVTQAFQLALERAGLPRQRFHDLRHACASFLLAQGIHWRVVMETLGHSQMSTTMDLYSHVLPDLQREAAAKMDELLTKGG